MAASDVFDPEHSNFDASQYPNLTVVDSRAVHMLLTEIRDASTVQREYIRHADRVLTILAEEALALLATPEVITTPCGQYQGLRHPDPNNLCAVSIVRSGDICLEAVRKLIPECSVGKILMQRDESSEEKTAKHYYTKLPPNVGDADKTILLVDPMLASGGSSVGAIQELERCGVAPNKILFLVTVAAPEGIAKIFEVYPELRMICLAVDQYLNKDKYIVPGLGDFGDRYYGTQD